MFIDARRVSYRGITIVVNVNKEKSVTPVSMTNMWVAYIRYNGNPDPIISIAQFVPHHGKSAYDQLLRLWLYLQNKLRHTASPLRGFAACVFPAVAAAVAVSSLPGLFKPGNCAKLRLFTLQWEP